MADALARLRSWGEDEEGSPAWSMAAGVDPADERSDVPPRPEPVADEERADAVAASVYAAWSGRLSRAVFADDFEGTGIGVPGGADATKALLHILEDVERTDPGFVVHTRGPNGESTLWDDRRTPEIETRDEILLGALADALEFLMESFEASAGLWGNIHRVRFQHFFGQAGIRTFDLGDFPAPGGRFTVNPAGFSFNSDSFVFSSGPSMRFVVELDPAGIRAMNILPGGNNGNPGGVGEAFYNLIQPDIHYGDHAPGWINGHTFDSRITREAVAADAEQNIVYVRAEV
jgi:penicillin amidase